MHLDTGHRVVKTALGVALAPGLRVLPAADCLPVGISGNCGQTQVTSVGQHNLLFLSIALMPSSKKEVKEPRMMEIIHTKTYKI